MFTAWSQTRPLDEVSLGPMDNVWKSKAAAAFDTANWMSQIADTVFLSDLTIPGTHDSAAFTYNLPFVSTQRLDFLQQLDAGVRYFDLRCGLRGDILEMVHGPTYLGLRLEEVLTTIYGWLEAHPLEALIVQLKRDRADDKSTIAFSQALVDTLTARSEYWRLANTTPLLGEVRGKIQLFRRFRGPDLYTYGINLSRWQNNPSTPFTMYAGHGIKVTVQDHYERVDPEPFPMLIENKMAEIQELMTMASINSDPRHWYINFTSAYEFNWSYRYPPRQIAEGGWLGWKRLPGINDTLSESLSTGRRRYGILAMDYPDSNEDLILRLILSNFGEPAGNTLSLVLLVCAVLTACLLFWRLEIDIHQFIDTK